MRFASALPFFAPLTVLAACQSAPAGLPPVPVPARAETASVAGAGDAADDPAFWRASDPAHSRILGTDKQSGLYVYDLAGQTLQYLDVGRVNNIDVRYGFAAGDRTVDIAVATDRTRLGLMVFFIDPASGGVETAPGGVLPTISMTLTDYACGRAPMAGSMCFLPKTIPAASVSFVWGLKTAA